MSIYLDKSLELNLIVEFIILSMSSKERNEEFKLTKFQSIGVYLIATFVNILLYTLRIRYDEETKKAVSKGGASSFMIWHNRLLITARLKSKFRRNIPMCGLVSASKDGAYLSGIFKYFKIDTIRGSSSRRGALAIIKILQLLKEGKCVTVTPDGPRGPKYEFKGATLSVAKKTNSMVVFMRAYPERFIKFRSWDDFIIPMPFSKLHFRAVCFDTYTDFENETKSLGLEENEYAQILLGRDDLESDNEKIKIRAVLKK
ncbi:MAG: DUF374 domain-containing protein [Opitutales bacterium]